MRGWEHQQRARHSESNLSTHYPLFAGLTIAVMVIAALGIVWNTILAILTAISWDTSVIVAVAYVSHRDRLGREKPCIKV
jgi:Flp pilus assembly protein TadB